MPSVPEKNAGKFYPKFARVWSKICPRFGKGFSSA